MITKRINTESADIIEQYRHFQYGNAVCSVPYFNNRRTGLRAALRSEVGKGSPRDIFDEITFILAKDHLDTSVLTNENLKKLLVDYNIGIDCSGFVFYVLKKEGYSFPYAGNIFRKIYAKFNPVKNIDVLTFAHNKNSRAITIREALPGDIITMIGVGDASRNHIIIIDQIEYQNDIPATIHYVHAIAWPTDGQYGHGIHEGKIEIINPEKSISEQVWTEQDQTGVENHTHTRALQTTCELRRVVVS